MLKLRSAVRGLVAIAILVAFSFAAFSPGVTLAAEKATSVVLYVMPYDQVMPAPAVQQLVAKGKKAKPPKHETTFDSAEAKTAGYLNWRMRDTTRNV